MTVPANLLNVLACPSCKGKLVWGPDKTSLVCRGEQLAYPVRDGIPAMIAQEATQLTAEEMKQVEPL